MIYRIPTLKKHPIYLCMGVRGILGCFCILFINYTYICDDVAFSYVDPMCYISYLDSRTKGNATSSQRYVRSHKAVG
jgi:hypothetical protein